MKKVFELFPSSSSVKPCGECSECCKGYLKCEVNGQKLGHGVGCNSLINGRCTIYESRPENPCRGYNCYWKTNFEIPDNMRPDISKVIINDTEHKGFFYLKIIELGQKIDSTVLANIIRYANIKGYNLEFEVDKHVYHIGTPEFLQMVEDERKNNRLSPD